MATSSFNIGDLNSDIAALNSNKATKSWTFITSTNGASVSLGNYSEILIILKDAGGTCIGSAVYPTEMATNPSNLGCHAYDPNNTDSHKIYIARVTNGISFNLYYNAQGELYAR